MRYTSRCSYFLREQLRFPEETQACNLVRNNVVGRDIIREERLDIYCYSPSTLENTFTLTPHRKELVEITVPLAGIVVEVLCIRMPEIIRGRCYDQIDTLVRVYAPVPGGIRTYDAVDKRENFMRFTEYSRIFFPFRTLPYTRLSLLSCTFSGLMERIPVLYFYRSWVK